MFKLTLQEIALGWFETEAPTWQTEHQMKQAFLKRFNPWGDTRRQQQDAWNKLKFDMNKGDVNAFVVDMKMLASILGHNDDIVMEKFKDIFPDPNIEAALIAMDNFAAMQAKAKQLVQIYKPAHASPMASAALLVHTAGDVKPKSKDSQPKSMQHQLAPINPPQQQNDNSGNEDFRGNYRGRGRGRDRRSRGRGGRGNSENRDDRDREGNRGEYKQGYNDNRGQSQENSSQGRKKQWDDNGDRNNRDRGDSQGGGRGQKWDNNNKGQGNGNRGWGRRWNQHPQYPPQGYKPGPNYQDPNHYRPPPMGYQGQYQQPPPQYPPYNPSQQYPNPQPQAQSPQALNVCQLCHNAGHYDYQCEFAGDFLN